MDVVDMAPIGIEPCSTLTACASSVPRYGAPRRPRRETSAQSSIPTTVADATAFCTDAELRKYTTERVTEFEAGSEPNMQIDRRLFHYPIFDQSRTKAVVVVTHLALNGRFRSSGKIGRHSAGLRVAAQVYSKVGGSWRLLRSHILGIS